MGVVELETVFALLWPPKMCNIAMMHGDSSGDEL